jgi:hypothetical protein
MSDFFLKIYVGGTKFGSQRERNIRALALKHFPRPSGTEGNISALFNAALNQTYNLDPNTGEELNKEMGMVAERKPKPYGNTTTGRRSRKSKNF